MRSASALLIVIYSDVFACKVTSSTIVFSPERKKKLALCESERDNLSYSDAETEPQREGSNPDRRRSRWNLQGESLTHPFLLASFRIQRVLAS